MARLEKIFSKQTLPAISERKKEVLERIESIYEKALKKGVEYRKTSTKRWGPTHEGPCIKK